MDIVNKVFSSKNKTNQEYYVYSDLKIVTIVFYLDNIINKYFKGKTEFNGTDFNELLNILTCPYGVFHNIKLNIDMNCFGSTLVNTQQRKIYVKIDSNYNKNKLIPFIIYALPILCSRENLKLELLQVYYPILKINNISLYNVNKLIHAIFIIGQKDDKNKTISYTTLLDFEKKQKLKILEKKKILKKLFMALELVPNSIQECIIQFI
jgi:hypothetical protein